MLLLTKPSIIFIIFLALFGIKAALFAGLIAAIITIFIMVAVDFC